MIRIQLHQVESILSTKTMLTINPDWQKKWNFRHLSKEETQVTELQEEYLSNNSHLDYEFQWQQSKVDVESVTKIAKTQIIVKEQVVELKYKKYIKLAAGKPITDQIKKLKGICIDQEILPSYSQCFHNDKYKHTPSELLEVEKRLKKDGYFHFQRKIYYFYSSDSYEDTMTNYEEPESDHLL